jgi:porphobilinogen synthase
MQRGRRLRHDPFVRSLARETRMSPDTLIWPLFIAEGENIKEPIAALDGQFHYSPDRLSEAIDEGLEAGVDKFLLFGLPDTRTRSAPGPTTTTASCSRGFARCARKIPQRNLPRDRHLHVRIHEPRPLRRFSAAANRWTTTRRCRISTASPSPTRKAGADMVAPSDMMDGRVGSIRRALDEGGLHESCPLCPTPSSTPRPITAPSATRRAPPRHSATGSGYQMDFHNVREALREAEQDEQEGADILMVKPAMSYGDVIRAVRAGHEPAAGRLLRERRVRDDPHGGKAGLIDEHRVMCEAATRRLPRGRGHLITYYAKELAEAMRAGEIG